jgi:Ser/Thr protein kinase RdoA (MazF antagonist)
VDSIVHLDLRPGNVLLGADGPTVIDWPNASRGAKASDVALTWTSLACFEHDSTGVKAVVADRFRALFVSRFLAAAGRLEARPLLAAMVAYRRADPRRRQHVRPREREALLCLAAGHEPWI